MGVLALTMVVAAALSALTAATAGARQSAAFKAAWIYVGPAADHGWSQAHNDGRLYVQKMLGSKVQTTYKENVPEGPQTSQVIDSLVRDGNKIIFATSFGYQAGDGGRGQEVPERHLRAGDRDTSCPRTWASTTAPGRMRSTSPGWPRARPPRRA